MLRPTCALLSMRVESEAIAYAPRSLATLAFNHEEITARVLEPALLELDGISRETIQAHYKLYEGYVNKRNEIMEKLAEVDLAAANQAYSEVRALKVELSFALGGIKNHEIYFEHLGGGGGDPDGAIRDMIVRDFGSAGDWLNSVFRAAKYFCSMTLSTTKTAAPFNRLAVDSRTKSQEPNSKNQQRLDRVIGIWFLEFGSWNFIRSLDVIIKVSQAFFLHGADLLT